MGAQINLLKMDFDVTSVNILARRASEWVQRVGPRAVPCRPGRPTRWRVELVLNSVDCAKVLPPMRYFPSRDAQSISVNAVIASVIAKLQFVFSGER